MEARESRMANEAKIIIPVGREKLAQSGTPKFQWSAG